MRNKPSAEIREGYRLAVQMLTEFEERLPEIADASTFDFGSPNKDGNMSIHRESPQDNVFLCWLGRLRARNNRDVDDGFAAVLTDYFTTVACGSCPDAAFYRKLVKRTSHHDVPEKQDGSG